MKRILIFGIVVVIGLTAGYQIGAHTQGSASKEVVFHESGRNAGDFNVFHASATGPLDPPSDIVSLNKAFVEIAERINPSVVTVTTEKVVKMRDPWHDFFGDDWFSPFFQQPQGEMRSTVLGSGVIVSEDGYILTNNHVVEKADEINVKLIDRREYSAKVIGADPRTDVAVIKIDADHLQPAVLGNSDELRIGEWVLAIGSPFSANLDHTVTAGIVSAKGRSNIINPENYEDFIQTDAAINPGNSGGALVNIRGELVGINTAIATGGRSAANAGIGFAIPINLARRIMTELVESGKVVRAWLGVYIQDVNADMAAALNLDEVAGALVGDVVEDSPAEKGGVKVGDIIVEFDGTKIIDGSHLRNRVSNSDPGSRKELVVIRDGKRKELKVKLDVLPEEDVVTGGVEPVSHELGLDVEEITPELSRRYGYRSNEEGVIVVNVDRGSAADRAGIRPGDIIKRIGDNPIYRMSDYSVVIKDVKKGSKVLFLIKRGSRTGFYVVEVPE